MILHPPIEHMGIGCNRLLTVAHDFYFQATEWRYISIKMGSFLLLLIFRWLIHVSTLADP
jgi:hypothetical protein